MSSTITLAQGVAAAAAASIVYAVFASRKKPSAPLPPGPPPKFLLGNMADMPTEQEWKTFTRWAEEYVGPRENHSMASRLSVPFWEKVAAQCTAGTLAATLHSTALLELMEYTFVDQNSDPLPCYDKECSLEGSLNGSCSGSPAGLLRSGDEAVAAEVLQEKTNSAQKNKQALLRRVAVHDSDSLGEEAEEDGAAEGMDMGKH